MVDLIPASEAARMLGMSRERVVRQIQAGKLSGKTVAGRWLADRRAVERTAQERQHSNADKARRAS